MINETLKQNILSFLRKSRLLALENWLMYCVNTIRNFNDNRKFLEEHPGFNPVPHPLAYDAYGNCHYRSYYEGGLEQAKFYVDTIRKFKPTGELTVCEWGCGPARIIRHIPSLDAQMILIGTDYNQKSIVWCMNNFSEIKFIINKLEPPLELDKHSVDVLYCWSVFTHLSELMHYAWITEIKRVLKPGGLFMGSFHGDNFKNKLLSDELATYLKGDIVNRSMVMEGSKNYTAFHPENFVINQLFKGFSNIQKIDAHYVQTIWCATTPE